MQDNLKDILSNLSTEVDQETLLLYLQGKLSADQQHQVEKQIMENPFAADALEGLQSFGDQQSIQLLVDQLNRDLRKKTAKKKAGKEKWQLKQDPWAIVALIVILLLVFVAYFIIHRYSR